MHHRRSAEALALLSKSQAAIVRLAPSQVPQVHSECWLESAVAMMAHSEGRYEKPRSELNNVNAQVRPVT